MMFIGVVLLILILYIGFHGSSNHSDSFHKKRISEDILNERYANGEIDDDTYLRMKKNIRNPRGD